MEKESIDKIERVLSIYTKLINGACRRYITANEINVIIKL